MAEIDLHPRKRPRQRRAQATVEVILTAAARVLARDSLAGFNTNRVAEVAGISVGSLYQYFPNKAALVTALIDRAQNELADKLERIVAHTSGRPLGDTLRAIAHFAVEQQYATPLLAAALDHEEKRLPLQPRLMENDARIAACIDGLLQRQRDDLPAELPANAAADMLCITKALVESDAGGPPSDHLEDRVVRALLGYLTWRADPNDRAEPSRSQPSGPTPP